MAITIMCLLCAFASFAESNIRQYHFKNIDHTFDSIAALVLTDEFNRNMNDTAALRIKELRKIASAFPDPVLNARATLWEIRSTQINANPDSCITILGKVRDTLPKDYDYDYACLSYQLAGNHDRIGNYFNTYQLQSEAIPVFEKYDDNYFLGNAHLLMGLTYSDIGDFELADYEIDLAEKYYTACGYPTNRIYFFKASMTKDEKEEIRLYNKSIETGQDDPGMTVQAYEHLASIYDRRNLPDSALKCIAAGKEMRTRMLPGNILLKILLNIREAVILCSMRDYDQALLILKETENIAPQYRNEYWEPSIYKYLSRIYETKDDRTSAFLYLKKYQEAFERQVNTLRGQEIPKAKAREAISRQKEIISNMQQENKDAHNRFVIILLILVAVVLSAAALFLYFYQRIKLKRIENRELRTSLEKEMIIKRLNLENFERDIKQKECEISSSVLLLSNKNNVLQQIGEITKIYSEQNRMPKEFVEQVNQLVSDSLKGDDEWNRFKIHFEKVHPDFFNKLKSESNELTENDLRLCAYIKIGMRAKDIAAMLSVSPASVNTNRYRLRRKLGLTKEDSLDDYIRKI